MDDDSRLSSAMGMLIGAGGSIAVAGLLATIRESMLSANIALVLMVVVVLAAAIGGRAAGAVSALAAALSYDFFHTVPYHSLRIDSDDDVETAVLLLIAGLIVGQITARARVNRAAAVAGRSELRRIHRVAELAAQGAPAADVIAAGRAELTELLTLQECRYETAPYSQVLERIERSGVIVPPRRPVVTARMGRRGLELPHEGVELPVLHRGDQIGRFTLVPTPGIGASLEERVVAVAIADQVGAVLG